MTAPPNVNIIPFFSPNFSDQLIPVEFVVIHYTACSLRRTLEIFSGADERKVCAHFVIAENGDLYDLGGFWDGPVRQGAHAGESLFRIGSQEYRAFNKFSIGIEIVNLNGNVFDFTEDQYRTLFALMRHLRDRFPALNDPNRIVGHEQIAGFRGKADPGRRFDWRRFFVAIYGGGRFPERPFVCSAARAEKLAALIQNVPVEERDSPEFWTRISAELEAGLKG
jgi:N-acetyl-anhydromuramyl-L-alanine amidase AmpD